MLVIFNFRLYNMKLECYNYIKWNQVVNHFEGFTASFLKQIFGTMSGNLTPRLQTNDVNSTYNK